MPTAIPLATGSLTKWFATISPSCLLSCRRNCSPRYAFGNRPQWPSKTTLHSSSSTSFSYGECERDTTPKDRSRSAADEFAYGATVFLYRLTCTYRSEPFFYNNRPLLEI